MALLNGIQVVSIIGRQGSGKSTVGQLVAHHRRCQWIETSEVVRSVVGPTERKDMPKTNERTSEEPNWLGDAIAETYDESRLLLNRFRKHPTTDMHSLVLTGVREVEVHEALEQQGATVYPISLHSPKFVRFERLKQVRKVGSWEEFEEQDHAEGEIGLDVLLSITHYQLRAGEFTNPAHIAKAILALWEAQMEDKEQ